MATSRRKLDEKHLKILREWGSNLANRTCFDCHQKGPTYINMTIGSFVCTSCSGILRGLNPPHRVKSISMASFTPEEIELIKSKGNEHCQAVWLGLYEGKSTLFLDTKDEHKIRDFMIQKYEKKRFYIDPSVAFKNSGSSQCKSGSSSNASTPGSSDSKSLGSATTPFSSNPNTTVSRPISNLQTAGSSPCLNGLPQSSGLKSSSSLVLLSGLDGSTTKSSKNQAAEVVDPFGFSDVNGSKSATGFANFDNANIFSNTTEDRLFSVPSSVPDTPFLPNSQFHSPAALGSQSLSSSPNPFLLHKKASHSQSSSPEANPWESLEEELSAAMPLIPTGELPPTYQPCTASGKSTNIKKGVSGSPVVFAAGVSAQFMAPSVDAKTKDRLAHLRETRASSLPSSLSDSYFNSVKQEFKNSSNWSNKIISKGQSSRDLNRCSSVDKYFENEHPLASAMPLISIDKQSRKFNRNMPMPLGSHDRNSSEETLAKFTNEDSKKTSSFTDLRTKGISGIFSSKNIRKVSSYHNISTNAAIHNNEDLKLKPNFSRQLSAISHKMRARLMFDDDLQPPNPRLSSSLPENSPNFINPNANLSFANQSISNTIKNDKLLEPITVTYNKSFTINKASDFTNTVDGWKADFSSNQAGVAENNYNFPICDEGRSCCSELNIGGQVANNTSIVTVDVAEQPLHVLLTSKNDFCNLNVSENCSSTNANLTCLASPFITGTSNSSPHTTSLHPSFSSNPLTPFSSSSKQLSSNAVDTSSSGGVTLSTSIKTQEDRYAALKDLDEKFKHQKEVEKPPQNNGVLGLFSSSPGTGSAFGTTNGVHYSQNGSSSGTALFGTSPVASSTAAYTQPSTIGNAWNPTGFNPFSGGTPNANTPSIWSNNSAFGTVTQNQSNPFTGGIDSNFNSSFGPGVNGTSSNSNTNWANFSSPPNDVSNGVPVSKIAPNPWASNSTPNPFANSQVPLSGSPYNPFL